MTKHFSAFMERKDRQSKDNLRTLGKLFTKSGFQVKDHLNHHSDPYLYIEKPVDHDPIIESLEFGGIRLYTLGKDIISFRCQNKSTVQPYGTAYQLDVKGYYKDLMKEGHGEQTIKDLIKYMTEEILNFFMIAAKSQKQEEEDIDDNSLGKIVDSKPSTQDYSSQVSGDLRRNN